MSGCSAEMLAQSAELVLELVVKNGGCWKGTLDGLKIALKALDPDVSTDHVMLQLPRRTGLTVIAVYGHICIYDAGDRPDITALIHQAYTTEPAACDVMNNDVQLDGDLTGYPDRLGAMVCA